MRVLIIKTSSLGDIIHAMPAVKLLAANVPDVKIDWLIKPQFKNMLKYCPNLDEIILFEDKKFGSFIHTFQYTRELIRRIRRKKYDMVIDLQGLMRSAVFAGFSDAAVKAGFARPRERLASLFYNRKVDVQFRHAVDRNLDLMSGVLKLELGTEPDAELLKLEKCEEFASGAEKILKDAGYDDSVKLIAAVPGARWNSKKFPVEFFVDIMEKIHGRMNVQFMLLGGPDEKDDGEKIENTAQLSNMKLFNFIGRSSIGESAELLRRADMILCNDSGPMHIGAATGTPLCAFFGPTRPERTGPYGRQCRVFRNEKCHCIGCLKRECPLKPDILCHRIDNDDIVKHILEILTKN